MSVNVSARVQDPHITTIELKISMPYGEWMRLREQLRIVEKNTSGYESYPSWRLAAAIERVLGILSGSVEQSIEVPE